MHKAKSGGLRETAGQGVLPVGGSFVSLLIFWLLFYQEKSN